MYQPPNPPVAPDTIGGLPALDPSQGDPSQDGQGGTSSPGPSIQTPFAPEYAPDYNAFPPAAPGSYEMLKDMQFNALANRQKENERIDGRAAMKIRMQQLKDASDARNQALVAKLKGLTDEMSTPPPAIGSAPGMSLPEIYTGLIQGILTGNFTQGANTSAGLAAHRGQIEDQNALNAYKAKQLAAGAEYETTQHSLGNEDIYRRSIDQEESRGLLEDQRIDGQNGRAARSQWERANDPGEIRSAARILKEQYPEFAPTEAEVQAKVQASGQKAAKEYNDYVQSIWKNSDSVTAADRVKLATWKASLADPVNGYGIPAAQLADAPSSEAIGKARMDEIARHNKEIEKQASQKFTWERDTEFAKKMRLGWYNAHTSRENAGLAAQRNDYAGMRVYLDAYDHQTQGDALNIAKKVEGLNAKIAGKKQELAGAHGRKARDVQSEIDDLSGQLKHYQDEVDTMNSDRGSTGLPHIDPGQLLQDARDFAQQQDAKRAGVAPASPFGGQIGGQPGVQGQGAQPPKVLGIRKVK